MRNTIDSRQKRRRRGGIGVLLFFAMILALLGGGGYYWWAQQNQDNEASGSKKTILKLVSRGPFDHVVLEQGEIESSSNNEVKCEVKGRGGSGTPILKVIPEGTFVKKGDFLCQLDASALEQEAKNQRIAVSAAESTVISSKAAVEKAKISRQEYLDGTYLTERKAILSEISVAQQNLRKTELALQSAERLAAKGTLKPLQIEAEQFSVQNAQSTLDSAQGRLKVLDELTKAKMLVQLDSDIATANAKLESDQTSLAEEKQKLAEIQSQIAACEIKAPADGQVVYANKYSSRGGSDFVVEPGSYVREQQTIFLLPDPAKMQVKAKVNESRITLIREGMPVKIRVSAVDNDLLGRVTKVNKYAEPGNWYGPNVKEYAVFVQIIDPPREIRTGMTAEVRIFVERIPDAIQVPIMAVYETKRHHFVLVKKGDTYKTYEIEVGGANDQFITAKSGVDEGDQVVLDPRNHLDKMKIPPIEEADDRDALAKIASEAPRMASSEGGGMVEGRGTYGGRGGSGSRGAGGFDISAFVNDIFVQTDKNADGKISKEEAQSESRMAAQFEQNDANNDRFLDKAEIMAGMRKAMAARSGQSGAAGPPPGTDSPGSGTQSRTQGGAGGPPGSRGAN